MVVFFSSWIDIEAVLVMKWYLFTFLKIIISHEKFI